ADGGIRHVECGPVPAPVMEEQAIDHIAPGQAAVHVAERSSEHPCQRKTEQLPALVLPQQIDAAHRSVHGDGAEEEPLPAAGSGQETESCALVMVAHQIEKAGDVEMLAKCKSLQYQMLGVEVERDDDGAERQPLRHDFWPRRCRTDC